MELGRCTSLIVGLCVIHIRSFVISETIEIAWRRMLLRTGDLSRGISECVFHQGLLSNEGS